MKVLPSALAHGFSEEEVRHAVANAVVARLDKDEDDDVLLFIGAAGPSAHTLLEVKGRQADELLIFHAMTCRPSYRERYLP